jgi:hypothetical protein
MITVKFIENNFHETFLEDSNDLLLDPFFYVHKNGSNLPFVFENIKIENNQIISINYLKTNNSINYDTLINYLNNWPYKLEYNF